MSDERDDGPIDGEMRALLRAHISSFDELEVLVLLFKHSDRAWSAGAVANAIGIGEPPAVAALAHLLEVGLVGVAPQGGLTVFRFGSGDPNISQVLRRLERAFDTSRVEVMKIMSSNSLERIRGQAMEFFAGALGRKRPKDG